VQDLQLIYRELHFGHVILLVRLDGTNGGIDGINLDFLLGTLLAPIAPIYLWEVHMPDRKKDNQSQERPTPVTIHRGMVAAGILEPRRVDRDPIGRVMMMRSAVRKVKTTSADSTNS
jgi:hypothetical protein